MSDIVTAFTGTTGLNTKVDPFRLKFNPETGVSELAECVNCDIDDTGAISRRAGQTEISSVASHSVWCDGGAAFVVQDRTAQGDSAIYLVNQSDYSLTGVRSDLTQGNRVAFCQVGDRSYYLNGAENGYIEDGISYAWEAQEHVGANTDRKFYGPPIGTKLAWHLGCMHVITENVAYVSEPYAYGKFRMSSRFFQFGSNILLYKPVANGIWISDEKSTGFIANAENFESMFYRKKLSIPAHEWSENNRLVDLSKSFLQIPGLSAVWSCNEGLCVGTEDGRLIIVDDDKINYQSGTTGATVVSGLNTINTVF